MKLKSWIIHSIACVSLFVASIGIYPACWGTMYQPEVPEELLK